MPIGKSLVNLLHQGSQQGWIKELEPLREGAATHPIHIQTLLNSGHLTEEFKSRRAGNRMSELKNPSNRMVTTSSRYKSRLGCGL